MFSRRVLRTPIRALRIPQSTRCYASETPPGKKPPEMPKSVRHPWFILEIDTKMSRKAALVVTTAGAGYYYLLQYGSNSSYRHASEQQITVSGKDIGESLDEPPSTIDPVRSLPYPDHFGNVMRLMAAGEYTQGSWRTGNSFWEAGGVV